jgi:hypothetical protein
MDVAQAGLLGAAADEFDLRFVVQRRAVLGMQQTVVNPPATAAAAPLATVSSSSSPGSRK